MLGQLDENLYTITSDIEEAEIAIINTCGFIMDAKVESINYILEIAEYKESGTLEALIVAGCLSQKYREELLAEIPEIDGIIGTNEYHLINQVINEAVAGYRPSLIDSNLFSYENPQKRVQLTPRHYRYIKIAEGCNNHCSFCVIPQIRGTYRSRSIETILIEAQDAVANGAKELILVAQDSSYYGNDLYGKPMLATLIKEILQLSELSWLRVHYLYPGGMTDELIDLFANNPKLVKYIDLPLQHSEEKILKRMVRPGYQADIIELINKIRIRVPQVAIRTSIIVGFPGETEEDFRQLSKFVKEMEFDRLGVFAYSDEEDCAAYKIGDKVSEDIKESRVLRLMNIQNKIAKSKNSGLIGSVQQVIIDEYDEENSQYIGRTEYDAPEIDGQVFITNLDAKVGEIVTVRITHAFDYDLVAEGMTGESTK
jgi:ribosomal protein S12 methylthiotransferase